MWFILGLISMLLLNQTFSANILFVANVPSPSHHIWNRALALGLVDKGHNLTLISPDKETVMGIKNYTTILLEDFYEKFYKTVNINELANYSPLQMLIGLTEWQKTICKIQLSTNGLQQLLDYPKDFKFDLILYDVTLDWCLSPLITRFNSPPIIGVTAYLLPPYLSFNYGNSLFPSYLPAFILPYTDEMTFFQRLRNSFLTRVDVFLQNYMRHPQVEAVVKERFGDDILTWQKLDRRVTLLLSNTDPLLDYPQPLPPNIIPVGGLHARKPKQLPKDLQKILDNAKSGVIVFSLGTNIRSDKLSDHQRKSLLEAFSRLNELIIWKFESQLDNLPKNVIIRKWLPQNDILAHPNVKLFIGHGGALSTQEATYHGVPVIVIPFILDQYMNAKRIHQKRLGLTINFDEITADSFHDQIREVLDNPIYRENMRKVSIRLHDQPQTPIERATFWVEYILRHGDDDLLSIKARDMPFYQIAEIDIVMFLLTIFCVVSLTVVKVYRILVDCIPRGQKIKKN